VRRESKQKCQFEEAHDFIGFDGKLWCRFHLPMRDGQGNDSSKAIWDGSTIEAFNQATFDLIGNAKTQNTKADFQGVVFPGTISFEQFTADNPLPEVSFLWAAFGGYADFHKATFSGTARFDEATFSGDAVFERATFSDLANFSCSPNRPGPSPNNNLQHDSFASDSFENAKFNGRAIFTNRKFTHPADFSGGHFKLTPEFYGCLLHQGTTFLGRKFLDRGKENVHAVMAYRTLKLAMESVRDRTNEAMFFAYEQEAMRKTKQAPPLVRLLSFLYSISSRYGQSIGLPLFWLGITTFIAFLVYAYLQYGVGITDWSHLLSEAYLRKSDALKKLWDILRASLEPIFKPLRILNSEDLSYRPRVQLLMLLQSLLSLIWVALFLLAVRRRFKLD
jgi:uncharacterized protein YjbI with pentapeptide repeats